MKTIQVAVGTVGAWTIYFLMWLFGSHRNQADVPWLVGPIGDSYIGDTPYEETARQEGLVVERQAGAGGLIPDFSVLKSPRFDDTLCHPSIRDFYEGTAGFSLDTWATTYFPARLALWLLVQTISRRVNQLNFPLDGLEMARGMTTEIVLLKRPDGSLRYTGWYRCIRSTGRAVYTGFYTTAAIPKNEGQCVKVVFPMPRGNATVLLRPENDDADGLRLVSVGDSFGDAGFYRVGQKRGGGLTVWRIRSLHERFHLFVEDDALRCEHDIRFLGFRVLSLHYLIKGSASRVAGQTDAISVA